MTNDRTTISVVLGAVCFPTSALSWSCKLDTPEDTTYRAICPVSFSVNVLCDLSNDSTNQEKITIIIIMFNKIYYYFFGISVDLNG